VRAVDVFESDLAIGGLEVFEGGGHVASVPERDGVDHQAEDVELVFLAFSVGLAEFAAMAVEHVSSQRVASLATVELDQDASSVVLVVEDGEQEDGLGDPADLGDGPARAGGTSSALEDAEQIGGPHRPGEEGPAEQ
jgi:hypothetical protein